MSSWSCSSDEPRKHDAGGNTGDGDGDGSDGDDDRNGDDGDGDGEGADDDRDACIRAEVKVSRVPPTVWFVIDNSLALANSWGEKSAWHQIRELLLDDNGVIPELQANVRFGLAVPGALTDDPACSQVPVASPALNNLEAMESIYPEGPKQQADSITYYGLKYILDHLDQKSEGPVAVITSLAVSGENLCLGDFVANVMLGENGYTTAARLVDDVVGKLAAKNVKVYAFQAGQGGSPGGGAPATADRLARIAQLGGTGKPIPFSDPDSLRFS